MVPLWVLVGTLIVPLKDPETPKPDYHYRSITATLIVRLKDPKTPPPYGTILDPL